MNKSSLFATLPGLLLLLVCVVGAAYWRATLLAAVLLAALVLCALSRLWSRSVLKKTQASIDEEQMACHAGETFDLTLRIRSRSFFPLIWLDAALPLAIGRGPYIIREGDDPHKHVQLPYEQPAVVMAVRYVWLLWQQEIACRERMRAISRGVTELSRISLQAGDGFGLAAYQRWAALETPARVVVYPRLVQVDVTPFLRLIQEAEAGARGQTEDVTLLRGSRPYSHGDPMRRINWRRLAMSGVMETNQYEMITPGCISFLLDLASFGYEEVINQDAATKSGGSVRKAVHETELERMISAIASLIRALNERGQRYALVISGYEGREAVICRPGSGEAAYLQAMEALAGIDYRGGEARLPLDELRALRRRLGTVHLCALTDAQEMGDRLAALGFEKVRMIVCMHMGQEEARESGCWLLDRIAAHETDSGGAP